MQRTIKKRLSRIMAILMVLMLCTGLIPNLNVLKDASAATEYKYKFSRVLITGGGDLTARFSIEVSGKSLKGLCTHGGPLSSPSGWATIERLDDDDVRKYLAYYYGYVRGWTDGWQGCDLARAFHYATYGKSYHQDTSRNKLMIKNATEYVKEHGIPSNFVAYKCDPTNGSQEFIAWGYWSSGSVKIVKKSTNSEISKAPGYTFSGIKYKIYEKKSTSSNCVATISLTKGGTSKAVTLRPDGPLGRTYYIKESSTNSYYKLNDKWYSVTISPNEDAVLKVSDEPKVASLTFKKKYTDKSTPGTTSKAGFKFTIVNTADSDFSYTATSTKDGTVKFTNIPIGTYKIKENLTSAQKKNYWVSITNPQKVKLVAGSNTTSFNWYNERIVKKPDLIIEKTCSDNGSEEGWKFKIENTTTGKTWTKTTDAKGLIRIEDVPAGKYKVTEQMTANQKVKYADIPAQTGTLANTDNGTPNIVFEFTNTVPDPTPVKVKKTSIDGKIEGIEFELSGTIYPDSIYERELEPVAKLTDENGEIDFGKLKPGNYVIEETGFEETYLNNYPLEGYDRPAQAFTVTKNGVVINGDTYKEGVLEFVNTPYRIKVKKTELLADGTETENPVPNAEFSLYELQDGNPVYLDAYYTDDNGEIEIMGIVPGEYILKETMVPVGYVEEYDAEGNVVPPEYRLTASDENDGLTEVKTTNQRKYGSIFVSKTDDADEPVANAEFKLYTDAECTQEAKDIDGNTISGLTNKSGLLTFKNLPWKTYYIKEINSPKGYILDQEPQKITIGKDAETGALEVDAEAHFVNTRMPGDVELTKTDTDRNIIKSPATYDLYKSDGTLVKSGLVTGQDNNGDGTPDGDGKILVEDLEWGAYYFLETVPPDGYALSSEKINFTIEAKNCDRVTKRTAVDEPLRSLIVATKKIKADEIWYKHGTPTFIFKLRGTTVNGDVVEYKRTITFSESYVEAHTADDGFVNASASFDNIPLGDYILDEEPVMRYTFDQIETATLENGTIDGESVKFALTTDNPFGAATFINKKYEWRDFSDTTIVNNALKKQKMYSALYAEYSGDLFEPGMPIENLDDYLDVFAVYDDGTSKELTAGEYIIADENGGPLNQTPTVPGPFSIFITYTEKGMTNTCSIIAQVAPLSKFTVTFDTNGGMELEPMTVYKYDTVAGSTNKESDYTPTREGHQFLGWYTDKELTQEFDVEKTEITSNITLYAKWKNIQKNYALVLANGDLVFAQVTDAAVEKGLYNGVVILRSYKGFETTEYTSASEVPWYNQRENIKAVRVDNEFSTQYIDYWFYEFTNCSTFDIEGLDVAEVDSLNSTFAYAGTNADTFAINGIENWDVSRVENLWDTFRFTGTGSSSTWTLDLSKWELSASTMYGVFYGLDNVQELDLSGFENTEDTVMTDMFTGMNELDQISVGSEFNWNTGHGLPTPSLDYVNYANGYWYADSDMAAYTPDALPNRKADTYYGYPMKEVLDSLQKRYSDIVDTREANIALFEKIKEGEDAYLVESDLQWAKVTDSVTVNSYKTIVNKPASEGMSDYTKVLGTVGYSITGTGSSYAYPYARFVSSDDVVQLSVRNSYGSEVTLNTTVQVLYLKK